MWNLGYLKKILPPVVLFFFLPLLAVNKHVILDHLNILKNKTIEEVVLSIN